MLKTSTRYIHTSAVTEYNYSEFNGEKKKKTNKNYIFINTNLTVISTL